MLAVDISGSANYTIAETVFMFIPINEETHSILLASKRMLYDELQTNNEVLAIKLPLAENDFWLGQSRRDTFRLLA